MCCEGRGGESVGRECAVRGGVGRVWGVCCEGRGGECAVRGGVGRVWGGSVL